MTPEAGTTPSRRKPWLIGLAAGAVILIGVGVGIAVAVGGDVDAAETPSPSASTPGTTPSPSPTVVDAGCPVVTPGVTVFDPMEITALSAEPAYREIFRVPRPESWGDAAFNGFSVSSMPGSPALFSLSSAGTSAIEVGASETGELLWQGDERASGGNPPTLAGQFDGTSVAVRTGWDTDPAYVATVDLETGVELARLEGQRVLVVPPAAVRGHYDWEYNVRVVSDSDAIYLFRPSSDEAIGAIGAYDPLTLDVLWETEVDVAPPYEGVNVVIAGDLIEAGFGDARLFLSVEDGSLVEPEEPRSRFVSGGRMLAFDGTDVEAAVSGIDPTTGEICWTVPGEANLQQEDGVLVRSQDGVLRHIDVADGSVIREWSWVPEGTAGRLMGDFYVTPGDGELEVIRPGEEPRTIVHGAGPYGVQAHDSDVVVVRESDGLVGIGLDDGEVRWRVAGPNTVQVAGGALYAATIEGGEIVVSVLE